MLNDFSSYLFVREITYSSSELAAIAGAFFFAAFVKGVTGLGFSTTCLPFLVYAVGLKRGIPLVLLPSITSNILVMVDAGYFREMVARFRWMLLLTIPGIVLGLWWLNVAPTQEAVVVLGFVLISYALFATFTPDLSMGRGLERLLGPVSGFITGVVNGITGSQIMPVLPYLLSLNLNSSQFVQAINCSFTLSSFVMATGLYYYGLLDLSALGVSALGLAFVYLGTKLGSRVRQHLSPSAFRTAVLVLLFALGVSLLAKGV
ncbi:Sulfite exporter TauE/SafE [Pseudovibrio axinellae]|uniref:Probable membrane transporter protein n=1 Tax=Pseudovibrio axinellae TaxID=989403 RepID=A0A166AT55_9HYPH|nr:sulfite exporter TauE/SafE family protein [Pseudovibrio axinellae]KZL21516.1 Sulfite exporter TauE/SafE [Pseudovibrio axinellae]SER07887.1 hypothetical protein SAMN05421798_10684 [Pseudovibrio axinellae]